MLVCLLAGCPGTPKSSVGHTRETAIPVVLEPSGEPVVVESPLTNAPHWYRVSVTKPSYVTVSIAGRALAIAVLRPDGTEIAAADLVTGEVAIRVSGATEPYHLTVVVTPELHARVDSPACNPYNIDPANPNCAGMVPCDPNKPDFANPVCCSLRCLRGPCSYEIVAGDDGPDGIYAWIGAGSSTGVVRGMHGTAEVRMRDGSVKVVGTQVNKVEANRSRIFVGPESDQPNLLHWIVRLEPPPGCLANATRRR